MSDKADCTRSHLVLAEALGDGVKGGVLQGVLSVKQLAGQPPAGTPSGTPRACEAPVHHWGPRVHRGGSCLHVAGLRCYITCDKIDTISADTVPQSLLVPQTQKTCALQYCARIGKEHITHHIASDKPREGYNAGDRLQPERACLSKSTTHMIQKQQCKATYIMQAESTLANTSVQIPCTSTWACHQSES